MWAYWLAAARRQTVKLKVTCPTCGISSELEVPEDAWDTVEGDVMVGRVPPGKVCEHGFKIEFSRDGAVLAYHDFDAPEAEYKVRPVRFTVQTALRNLSMDIVAALLTAGVSEQTIVLVGSLAVTMGVREFMERVLPESVDVGAFLYSVTKEEFATLPESLRQHMIINVSTKEITNSAFDEEQLVWMQKVLLRANMVTNQEAAETLVLKETSKLRTTVSLLRHLAARRTPDIENGFSNDDVQ